MSEKVVQFGVKGLLIVDEKYLIVHKRGIADAKFEFPGGRIEFGETIEDTLMREMMEETNLLVHPVQVVDTWNYIKDDDHQIVGIIYLCKLMSSLEDFKLSKEHDAHKWVEVSNTDQLNCLFEDKAKMWNWKALIKGIKEL